LRFNALDNGSATHHFSKRFQSLGFTQPAITSKALALATQSRVAENIGALHKS
jgi:hypothetical protein